jgi:hypothetical protein
MNEIDPGNMQLMQALVSNPSAFSGGQPFAQTLAAVPIPMMAPNDPNHLTMADAYKSISDSLANWVQSQRADASARGLWNDSTGLPTQAGMINAMQQYGGALAAGTSAPEGAGIRAYHGSPHDFDAFDASKIGGGEGAQAFGHGLYFAGNENVAKSYRDALGPLSDPAVQVAHKELGEANWMFDGSPEAQARLTAAENAASAAEQNAAGSGHMYEVNINADPEHFLDWDKPLGEQSMKVQGALQQLNIPSKVPVPGYPYVSKTAPRAEATGQAVYRSLGNNFAEAAQALKSAGVPGIRYLDQASRGQGQGSHNYVVFDQHTIEILRKYGLAGLITGAGAAAASGDKSQ